MTTERRSSRSTSPSSDSSCSPEPPGRYVCRMHRRKESRAHDASGFCCEGADRSSRKACGERRASYADPRQGRLDPRFDYEGHPPAPDGRSHKGRHPFKPAGSRHHLGGSNPSPPTSPLALPVSGSNEQNRRPHGRFGSIPRPAGGEAAPQRALPKTEHLAERLCGIRSESVPSLEGLKAELKHRASIRGALERKLARAKRWEDAKHEADALSSLDRPTALFREPVWKEPLRRS